MTPFAKGAALAGSAGGLIAMGEQIRDGAMSKFASMFRRRETITDRIRKDHPEKVLLTPKSATEEWYFAFPAIRGYGAFSTTPAEFEKHKDRCFMLSRSMSGRDVEDQPAWDKDEFYVNPSRKYWEQDYEWVLKNCTRSVQIRDLAKKRGKTLLLDFNGRSSGWKGAWRRYKESGKNEIHDPWKDGSAPQSFMERCKELRSYDADIGNEYVDFVLNYCVK
ncbi:hypothetical protein HF1_02950 [Mycoplasma haemofelis str. Langford 1]|uniref:Uncharacterized protein n=1 Tax=Mycoplasma haemofelis (strain Langford 1) TaxID=941640 RepID=E8ZGN2_MYCHL|nr:hypothetical protein [Mycoplasma haemofelis]CBY92303.1 hypothetical protein HF1_02950 [Mycoplasma haemofelis str. Langford 1]